MPVDDVPPDEMHLFGLTRDPLDAALRGESDDPAVAALVGDLRAAYLPEGTRTRSAALVAFAGTGEDAPAAITARPRQVVVEPAIPLGRRIVVGVAAFAATITGKIVLGGAVAAATLGGLHASEAVDVPLLPDRPPARTVPSTVPELPDAVDLPPSAGAIEERGTGTGDRPTELDRSEPASTPAPVPTPDPADTHRPAAEPDEGPGATDGLPATPAPVPQERPAEAQPVEPPAQQSGGRDAPAGRDDAGAPSGTVEQQSEPGAESAPTGGAQKAPSRP